MGLFNREVRCEKCGAILLKRELCEYDRAHQGRIKQEKPIKRICNLCMMEMFYTDLQNYKASLVVISPIKKYNAYVTYHFETLFYNQDECRSLLELLPSNGEKCTRCGVQAVHTWCAPDVLFRDNDPYKWEVNTQGKHELLCSVCLIDALKQGLDVLDITLRNIIPPYKGQGVLTPWEI